MSERTAATAEYKNVPTLCEADDGYTRKSSKVKLVNVSHFYRTEYFCVFIPVRHGHYKRDNVKIDRYLTKFSNIFGN